MTRLLNAIQHKIFGLQPINGNLNKLKPKEAQKIISDFVDDLFPQYFAENTRYSWAMPVFFV